MVSGEFQAGDTITVTAGSHTYTGSANADGSFSINVAGADLTAGGNVTASILAHDAAGNSATSAIASHAYTSDQLAPTQPTVALTHDTANGADNGDFITSNGSLTLSGVESGANVEYSIDGGGHWTSSFTAAEGPNTVQVHQIDAAGNVSAPSTPLIFTLDTVAPAAPTVALLHDTANGVDNSDLITNNAQLTIGAAAGRTFSVDGGPSSGTYTAPTTDGSHSVVVTDTDVAGNHSSGSLTFILDATAPVIAGSQNFNYAENQLAGAVVGTVAASDAMGITGYHFSNGSNISADGLFTIASNGQITLTDYLSAANHFDIGPHNVTYGVQSCDAAGNWSAPTGVTLSVIATVDSVDVTPPVVTAGQVLNYAENQSAGAVIATVAASDAWGVNDYRFSYVDPVTAVVTTGTTSHDGFYAITPEGQISITAAGVAAAAHNDFETTPNSFTYGIEAHDAAGHWSAATDITLNVTDVDEIAPAKPYITAIGTDSGIVGDHITNDTTLVFSGTAEAGSSVKVFVDGAPVGTVTADSSGVWSFDHFAHTGTTLIDGSTYSITAQATDAAGNTGAVSDSYSVIIDTTPPVAPTVALAHDSTDGGVGHDLDHTTNDASALTISAATEPVIREYRLDGGSWETNYTAPGVDGSHTVEVRDTDVAGNQATGSLTFLLDTVAPTAPTVTLVHDTATGADNSDLITKDISLTFSAAAADVTTRTYTVDGVTSSSYTAPTGDGSHTVEVHDADVAGNTATGSLTFTLDTKALAPVLSLAHDTAVGGLENTDHITSNGTVNVSGLETGAAWQYSTNGGTTWTDGSGSSFTLTGDGDKSVIVHQTDLAGNPSSASAPLAFTQFLLVRR